MLAKANTAGKVSKEGTTSSKKIRLETSIKRMLADVYTPVGIYLRLRDRFRDTILLESTDHHAAENSYSFICINAIAGIEIRENEKLEYKLPGQKPELENIKDTDDLKTLLWSFMQRFEAISQEPKTASFAQALYGYFSFDAVQYFETIQFNKPLNEINNIPIARYRLYQYVIAINHYKDELVLCENHLLGVES
ncbi:MAG TPA: anthranilate synthase component I family protein, partial [Flavisolibacter sp.]|nr:anthranilate synthase component I family protein [Flavisolibacter sp.]